MRKMRKLTAVIAAAVFAMAAVTGCGAKNDRITVGIGQFADHGSLDNCRNGFIEGLKEAGYTEGDNIEFIYENAQADTGLAAQISGSFVSKKVDMICAIATPIAQSAYGSAMEAGIPVIYTAVTDPVMAELAGEDRVPVGEVTGTSDKLPVEQQLKMIRTLLPEAEKIGIMYSTSEVNSISAIEEYKAAASAYGFEIVESGISTSADIPLAAESLIAKVDCINNLTDNTVVSGMSVILEKAGEAGIPVFGSEIEQVKKGCLATVGLDYFELGRQTGKMAAAVLKGEKKASGMPFEIIEEGSFYVNTAVAGSLELEIPQELLDSAAEVITEISQQ